MQTQLQRYNTPSLNIIPQDSPWSSSIMESDESDSPTIKSEIEQYFRHLNGILDSLSSNLLSYTETYMTKEEDKSIIERLLEQDFIVKIAPKRKYQIELDTKNIRKGKPKIVLPDIF